jgi:hypothetical protein
MPETRTLGGQKSVDNPNDVSIREDQQRIRLQLLERQKELDSVEQDPYVFSESFTFRFRQFKNTNFAGLWELTSVDAKGHPIEKIIDADALPNVLEAIGNIFANRGF